MKLLHDGTGVVGVAEVASPVRPDEEGEDQRDPLGYIVKRDEPPFSTQWTCRVGSHYSRDISRPKDARVSAEEIISTYEGD